MDNAPLLQQCRSHFPGLAWESSGASSCTARIPSLAFAQYLVVYKNDDDFEVSIWTNLDGGTTLGGRKWVGPDAIAQAAARWREFAEEAGAVVGQQPQPYRASPEIKRQRDGYY